MAITRKMRKKLWLMNITILRQHISVENAFSAFELVSNFATSREDTAWATVVALLPKFVLLKDVG